MYVIKPFREKLKSFDSSGESILRDWRIQKSTSNFDIN